MINLSLITQAAKIADNFFNMNDIHQDLATTIERTTSWYSNTDITNAEMLAAAVIAFGSYKLVPYDEIEEAHAFYFQIPDEFEETAIWDIEQSYRDTWYQQ